mmetsp:Transcript_31988/g.46090  ORF Transcript_31988/g.46090 Transcript_31988/m.46090 type:complete len:398 (+) Transcript_31988:3-1196(+)
MALDMTLSNFSLLRYRWHIMLLQFYIILLLNPFPSYYLFKLFESTTNTHKFLVSAEIDEEEVAKSNIVYTHDMSKQKAAVKAWSRILSEKDYNASEWARTMRKQPQNFFDHYVQILSNLFLEKEAIVNFALVGACDGTNDNTIRERYLPNSHWHGVFVEPFSINFRDLNLFMESHGVMDRTHLIQAGATSRCNSSTIKMKRPDYEEQNKSYPHWMRRQIGAVVPFNKLDRPMTGGWMAEFVRCVTGEDILLDWAHAVNKRGSAVPGETIKKMRAHVLKIDVEGHDYDVLMSFLSQDVPNSELPLLINFEAKSIADKFDLAKQAMENRGYVVSHFATDGFALLRGDRIYTNSRRPAARSRQAVGYGSGEVRVRAAEGRGRGKRGSGKGRRKNRKQQAD